MGTETRTQALWGAAGEKTLQCAKARQGKSEWLLLKEPFVRPKNTKESGVGKFWCQPPR